MSATSVLARKWRPKVFTQLLGQQHVVQALTNALTQNRLHHAYLFTGTRGVGKTTIARIFAKSLNCVEGVTATPCGVCSACTEIDGGRFIDLIELDAASNTGIDNMRDVLDNAQYLPTLGRYKVYLIDEVHMLSKAAFNSMLKTLEEPPAHVKFILATTDPQKIPVTVMSRCLQFNLRQLPPALIVTHLQHVLEQERIAFEVAALTLLARAARGSMRDALSLLDQAIAYSDSKVDEATVRNMLGAIDRGYLYDLLQTLLARDGVGLLRIADDMLSRSLAFDNALQDLATLLHHIALAQTVPEAIAEDEPDRVRLMGLAQSFSAEEIQLHYQIAIHGRNEIDLAPDEYAGFTMTLLRMLAFMPVGTVTPLKQSAKTSQAAPIAPPKPVPAEKMATQPQPDQVAAPVAKVTADPAAPLDWGTILAQLSVQGMVRELAKHCTLTSFVDSRMALNIEPQHKHLLINKATQDKLQTALTDYFVQPVRLVITFDVTGVVTPAATEEKVKQVRQKKAVEAIMQDPFVRDVQAQLDARVTEESIKPIQ